MKLLLIPVLLLSSVAARGQGDTAPEPVQETPLTLFPHADRWPILLAGQANIIFQAHPGFHSPYDSTNSLLARGEYKTSLVGTFYTGLQVVRAPRFSTDLLFDLESSGGRGISEALGLAGFTNLDVVRNPSLGSVPYMARAEVRTTLGLSRNNVAAQRTQYSLPTLMPKRRIELRFGKMSMPDHFDTNAVGTDDHLQFLNWTADNNGAWDYAADTRGYTIAAVTEYTDGALQLRYALALLPTVANGIDLQWSLHRAHADNYEADWNQTPLHHWLPERQGAVRLLAFDNHANMGDYREANQAALKARAAGETDAVPVISDHPQTTTVKYGFGGNFDQELTAQLRVYGRFGWNEGQHESYAYTEVDQTISGGMDLTGERWGRAHDKVGVAAITNAIKRDHQEYLALGGKGFLLGDGKLNYAREDILEAYYNAHQWRGLFTAFDLQCVAHPGYNKDRGPVVVFSVRSHVDF